MKPVLIVTATKSENIDQFKSRPIYYSLEKLFDHYRHVPSCSLNFHIVTNNTEGLSKVYNNFINDDNKDKIVLFVHDDVIIHQIDLVENLNKAIENFDIIGLAGSEEFNIGEKNMWHICSDRSKHSGSVTHVIPNTDLVCGSVYGPTPKRCLVMDGLFLAVNIERAISQEWKFDEDFDFHFYDLSSCLLANQKRLKMGTWNINVTHYGIGDSCFSTSWEENNKKFVEKWTSTKSSQPSS